MSVLMVLLCICAGVSGETRNVIASLTMTSLCILLGQLQFVQIREPSCADGTLVYFCARNEGVFTTWHFELLAERSNVFFDGSPKLMMVDVGSSIVNLTLISQIGTFINVTATISYSDAVKLNGTWMECEDMRLSIIVNLSKYCT